MPDYRWECPNSWCNWEFTSANIDEWDVDEAMAGKVECQKCGSFITERPKQVDPA